MSGTIFVEVNVMKKIEFNAAQKKQVTTALSHLDELREYNAKNEHSDGIRLGDIKPDAEWRRLRQESVNYIESLEMPLPAILMALYYAGANPYNTDKETQTQFELELAEWEKKPVEQIADHIVEKMHATEFINLGAKIINVSL
jgi:hypothetical protein